jgi:hypothetical protein
MVSMDVSNSENQFDWLEGSRYGSNCQKIHSTDVAEFKKPVQAIKLFERNNLEIQEFRLQFQRFFCPKRQVLLSLQQQNAKEDTSQKGT